MTVTLLLIALVAALAGAAFCAGAETGFLSVRRGRILHMARAGGARAKILHEAVSNMGRTMTALLVGNNLASVLYSSTSAALVAALGIGSPVLQAALSFLLALAVLYFGEFMPKLLFSARPLRGLLRIAVLWKYFARVFAPVGAVVQRVVDRVLPKRESKAKMTPEAVLKILQDRKDGVKLSELETTLISKILALRAKGEFVIPDVLLAALDETLL